MSYPKPIHWWVDNILPLVYDEALSYYEVVSKVIGYINGLTTDVTTIKDKITEIEAFLENIEPEKIDELLAKVDELETLVNNFDDRITTAENDIDSLEGRVNTAENDIDSLESRADTAEENIDSLEANDNELINGINIDPNSMVTFETKFSGVPINKYTVYIEPVQSGTGEPSSTNVRTISGWAGCNVTRTGKNFFSESLANWRNNIIISTTGEETPNAGYKTSNFYFPIIPGLYTVQYNKEDAVEGAVIISYYDKNKDFLSRVQAIPLSGGTGIKTGSINIPEKTCYYRLSVLKIGSTNIQVELGSIATNYEQSQYVTNSIAFPSEAGIVYSATLVANADGTGELKVRPYYGNYNGETLVGPWVSSMDIYAPGTTPTIGAQVVDLGGSETVYQLAIEQITTLLNTNNIWADCGNISITYGKYLGTIYDSLISKINELQALVLENIGG